MTDEEHRERYHGKCSVADCETTFVGATHDDVLEHVEREHAEDIGDINEWVVDASIYDSALDQDQIEELWDGENDASE